MSNEWIGVIQTTAPKYLKGATDNTIRKRLQLAMLRKKGRITEGHSGTEVKWQIQFDEAPVESRGDDQQVTYARRDLYRQLTLDWREYLVTDRMTKREKEMNNGNEALIKRYDQIMPNLVKAIDNQIGLELYVDGNATGNTNRFCGFETFCGAGTACLVTDRIQVPSDTYAGKSTALGAAGGTWSSDLASTAGVRPNAASGVDWPNGSGTPSYDYLSPKLINWSSTAFPAGVATWAGNCEASLRQAKIWCSATSGVDGSPDLVVMDPALYMGFQEKQNSYKQVIIGNSMAADLGFPGVLNFEGMAIHYEYGVPANCVYGHNLMEQEIMILGKSFYKSEGPNWDDFSNSYLFQVGVMGNMRFNPKAHFKMKNYAAS